MRKVIMLACMGLIVLSGYSQTSVVEFLKGGKADAGKLSQAYLLPYAHALGDGLNNGWYNSAKAHKLGGFDLSVSVSSIHIPESAKTFDIATLGLTKLVLGSGGNIAPTIAGAKNHGPQMRVSDAAGNQLGSFNMPGGTGFDQVPVPMAQLGFGLLPHTDLIARYVPDLKYNNNGDQMKLGLFGLGVKHNFKEWMPALKSLPFDASIFGSYSEVNAQSTLSTTLSGDNISVSVANDNNQLLKLKTRTAKYGLVVSKKLGILTFFGGVGQSSSEWTVDLVGKYTINTMVQVGGEDYTTKEDLVDPVALRFSSKNICMDAGLRLKVSVISLFASINKSEYTSYTMGVSLGTR